MRISKLVFLFLLPYVSWTQTLGYALEQIEGEVMIAKGLNGEGIKIGIIDGGFLGANHSASLSNHFAEKRIIYYKDFISPEMTPYGGTTKLNDDHGTHVWELIGGQNAKTGIQYGLATAATYYLARTDHGVRENRDEERFLIQAMDDMISQGVKLFNVSLGYTNSFDNSGENYSPEQIDGKSTWITRSLDSLLAIHDVTVVVSAGNDGDDRWRVLSAPADSKNVITVGASKYSQWENYGYSSIGPTTENNIKPDIITYASNGTSYSAPVITGLIACMLQQNPDLSPARIKEILIQSSHLYPYPNNHMGYGVPSCTKILSLLNYEDVNQNVVIKAKKKHVISDSFVIPKGARKRVTVYHKLGFTVLKKQSVKLKKNIRILRKEEATQSTVIAGKEVYEIVWE